MTKTESIVFEDEAIRGMANSEFVLITVDTKAAIAGYRALAQNSPLPRFQEWTGRP